MTWATRYIDELREGRPVTFRLRGNSMTPLIKSGDEVTLVPVNRTLQKGDIVLSRVKGNDYLHLVIAIQGPRIQIGNAHGYINGWTSIEKVFGIKI